MWPAKGLPGHQICKWWLWKFYCSAIWHERKVCQSSGKRWKRWKGTWNYQFHTPVYSLLMFTAHNPHATAPSFWALKIPRRITGPGKSDKTLAWPETHVENKQCIGWNQLGANKVSREVVKEWQLLSTKWCDVRCTYMFKANKSRPVS